MRKILGILTVFVLFLAANVFASPAVIVDKYTNDDAGVTNGALDVNILANTSGDVATLLSAVTESGASDWQDTSDYSMVTFEIQASSVSTGMTYKIEEAFADDETSPAYVYTDTVTADGKTSVSINGFKHPYLRFNISSYTDGTYTVKMIAGN